MSIMATLKATRSTVLKLMASVYVVFLTVGHSPAAIMSERSSELTASKISERTATSLKMVQASGEKRRGCLAQCEKDLAPCLRSATETKIPGHQDPRDYCAQERERCKVECRG
jgi:hypothetical protein